MSRTDLEQLAAKIRYDLTAAQGKLTELSRAIAALPANDEQRSIYVCEHCVGGLDCKTQEKLELHLANVHAIGLEESAPPPRTPNVPALVADSQPRDVPARTVAPVTLDKILPPRAPNDSPETPNVQSR